MHLGTVVDIIKEDLNMPQSLVTIISAQERVQEPNKKLNL
jgi:hypothetical protein